MLILGDGKVAVLDRPGGQSIVSVPYESLVAVFVSRSRQPRWRLPDGTETGGRVDVGRIGFFKPEQNWLTVIAREQQPLVIRLEDWAVRSVVVAVQTRAGIPVQRIMGREGRPGRDPVDQ